MRKAAHEITMEQLENEKWEFDHVATVKWYKYAGSVFPMKPHNGYEYCRVHSGKCVGKHSYQITYVMKRKMEAM